MKIANATVDLSASHRTSSRVEVEERVAAWVGRQQQGSGAAAVSASPSLSEAARVALSLDVRPSAASSAPASTDEVASDPELELLKSIVEMLTGERIRLMEASTLADVSNGGGGAEAQVGNSGFDYTRIETRESSETTRFGASGTIRSADGQIIQFRIGLSMSRTETESSSLRLRSGTGVSKDPLVLNFSGAAASLRNQHFRFDLMGDGDAVDMPVLGQGSGFLVLDALDGGGVRSGRQLFGPASGDGFADLARYDSDGNGWIDEADPVFDRLGVWTPDAQGGGEVSSLAARGVGALYLAHSATPFTLKDAGVTQGAVRSSGLYVREDGGVGSMQQVDMKV